jgi:hypothetical protein
MCGCNAEIIAVTEIYEMSVIVRFVTHGQITHPPAIIIDQVMTELFANLKKLVGYF